MSSLSRQFIVLICFFFCLISSYLAEAQINPCDPIASGNVDTDGDGISDICDDDDDNDGILDINEGFVAPTELISNGDFSNGLTDWVVNNPSGGAAPNVGVSGSVEFGFQTIGETSLVSLDLNDLANDLGVTTQNGNIGGGAFGNQTQYHFNGTGDMFVSVNPDAGGVDVGSFTTIDISFVTDWGLEAQVYSFGDISTLTPGNYNSGLGTGLSIAYNKDSFDNIILWNGAELLRINGYYRIALNTSTINLSVSPTGLVTFSVSGRNPPMIVQIPGSEWQDTNNSSWQFISSQTNSFGTNGNDRINNIELNGTAIEIFNNLGDSIEQSFTTSLNNTAEVSLEISTEGIGSANFNVLTEILDNNGAVIASNTSVVSSGTNTVNFNFLPSSTNTSIRVTQLSASGDLDTKQLLVDNISVLQGVAIDTDNDSISDHLDLDSDNDGCFDTVEANHTDGDNDGILGSSPVTVDNSGNVTGQGGYTGTNTNVIAANIPIIINTQPYGGSALIGGSYTYSVVASGGSTLNYQWQESTDNGIIWNQINDGGIYSGTTTPDLTLSVVTPTIHNYYYRVVITSDDNNCDSVISNENDFFVVPNMSLSDASITEGSDLVFTLTTTHAINSSYEFEIQYNNITTSNSDYDGTVFTGTLPANSTSMTFNVSTLDDTIIEGTETFELELLWDGPFPINIIDPIGLGTITDNDESGPGEGISVSEFTVDESIGSADFVITYTGPTVADAFTVDFAIADGTAISPDDYTVLAATGNVSFPANTTTGTTQTVTVTIIDDAILEASEDLNITLSNITNVLVAMVDDTGVGTITDNDGGGAGDGISVADFTVDESVGTTDFVITYTGPTAANAFTVDFIIADGTAISPDDYTVVAATGNVSFPANTITGTTQTVTVTIIDDAILEASEDLNITLSNITNVLVAMVDDTGVGTITDNDGGGTGDGISVADFTVDESAGTTDFVITYTGPTVADAFTVDFAITDGTAISPDDYTVNVVTGIINFPANTISGTMQTIAVAIVDDTIIETDENLNITLSSITNISVAIVDGVGIGTIIDNDFIIDIDSDDDGILDSFEDLNADGDDDPSTNPTNSDSDIYPDYLDIDSDNDGIPDNVEAQTTDGYLAPILQDVNANGLDDAYEIGGALGLIPVNTDGEDLPDYLDLDSDNDNIIDAIEGNDQNHDGIADVVLIGSDKDNDGLDDGFEGDEQIDIDVNDEINSPIDDLPNTDGNEEVDYRDIDDDGDGIDTINEDTDDDDDYLNDDFDNDGTPDYLDPDQPVEYEDVEVFNVVTPNGDGVHDFLMISGLDVRPENDLQIFNRWGILVYTTKNYATKENVFDGKSQARSTIGKTDRLPAGTYFYLLNYVEVTEKTISLSGYLYLN